LKEFQSILSAYKKARESDTSCVLATVVHVTGSSYRRAGARMLVDEYGNMTGAISGGCLEGDALRKALHALHRNVNKLVTYDTSDENDAVIGAQLGCNGVIQVLFEPLEIENENAVLLIEKAHNKKAKVVVGTFFHLDKTKKQPGTSFVIDHLGQYEGNNSLPSLQGQVTKDAKKALESGSSMFLEYINGIESQHVFLEVINPPIKLVLVGAGNDATYIANMADVLGWDIIVTDGRPTHAAIDRFISSCQVIVSKPEAILENIDINERTAFVLMTHNYHYDLSVLKVLLNQQLSGYIGILGPKKKYNRMLLDLKEEGLVLTKAQKQRIYAPVGVELGAETPSEIGLSILAEIQAVMTSSNGTFLRDKEGPIHQKKNSEVIKIEVDF